MKPEELMIGDFVLYDDNICIVDEIRVDNTAVLTALNTDITSIDGDQVSMDEITPILLTPEILEKNGFVKDKYGEMTLELDDALGTTEIVLIPSYDEVYYWWKVSNELITKIKSIHELQHVLRLCNILKEINV
jgi:hypothetical protein